MASVWIKNDQGEEQIFKEVAFLSKNGSTILLSTMLGEERSVEATIEKIDFLNSRVILRQ